MVGKPKPKPRPFHVCVCGDHAFVELTQGYVALCSPDCVEHASPYRWAAYPNRRSAYARTGVETKGRKRSFTMHSLFLAGDGQIDHINGNGVDNRITNLRRCTNQENQRNRHAVRGKSRFKGVIRRPKSWQACIVLDGIKKNIGCYPTEEEAARAYDAKAVEVFGEFARTNFGDHR